MHGGHQQNYYYSEIIQHADAVQIDKSQRNHLGQIESQIHHRLKNK